LVTDETVVTPPSTRPELLLESVPDEPAELPPDALLDAPLDELLDEPVPPLALALPVEAPLEPVEVALLPEVPWLTTPLVEQAVAATVTAIRIARTGK
jgi:hypothetical protein